MEFTCVECEKDSPLKVRAPMMVMDSIDFVRVPVDLEEQTRTYLCIHCKAENAVTLEAAIWRQLDHRK